MSRPRLLEQIKHELHQVESSIGLEMFVLPYLDIAQGRRMAKRRDNDFIVGVLPYIEARHPLHLWGVRRICVNLKIYTMEFK